MWGAVENLALGSSQLRDVPAVGCIYMSEGEVCPGEVFIAFGGPAGPCRQGWQTCGGLVNPPLASLPGDYEPRYGLVAERVKPDWWIHNPPRIDSLPTSGLWPFLKTNRVPEILARDPASLERPFAKCLSRTPKPEDWQTPLVRMVRMVVRGKTEAATVLVDCGADAAARHPDGRSLLQIARDQGCNEIASLLEARSNSE